jgi:hypothetical protein
MTSKRKRKADDALVCTQRAKHKEPDIPEPEHPETVEIEGYFTNPDDLPLPRVLMRIVYEYHGRDDNTAWLRDWVERCPIEMLDLLRTFSTVHWMNARIPNRFDYCTTLQHYMHEGDVRMIAFLVTYVMHSSDFALTLCGRKGIDFASRVPLLERLLREYPFMAHQCTDHTIIQRLGGHVVQQNRVWLMTQLVEARLIKSLPSRYLFLAIYIKSTEMVRLLVPYTAESLEWHFHAAANNGTGTTPEILDILYRHIVRHGATNELQLMPGYNSDTATWARARGLIR